MSGVIECRTNLGEVEFRGSSDGKNMTAVGYAAVFNKTTNLGGFAERVAPGTFKKTIGEARILALFNHDMNQLLGTNRSGTLQLAEDRKGLAYEISLPDTTVGRDVAALLERGDITGSSFGFRVLGEEWAYPKDKPPVRTLTEVALRDVGPVTNPAYPDTKAALRSLAEARSLDLDVLIAAANEDRLSDLLNDERQEEHEQEERQEDSREALTVIRRKFAHLL